MKNNTDKRLADAPEQYRREIEAMKAEGLLGDPEVIQALKDAAAEVADEQADAWTAAKSGDPDAQVQNN